MRDIKFRGKQIDNGEWEIGYYLFDGTDHYIVVAKNNVDEDGSLKWFKVDPATVGQFTGKLDCKGREIYGGMVVFYRYHRGIVSQDETGSWRLAQDDNGNFYPEYILKCEHSDLEIIDEVE